MPTIVNVKVGTLNKLAQLLKIFAQYVNVTFSNMLETVYVVVNNADPHKTAPTEQSDQGQHFCFANFAPIIRATTEFLLVLDKFAL